MPTFTHTTEIAAPIDQVFEWGASPENWQRTMPSLTDVEALEETEDGLRLRGIYQILGRGVTSEMEFRIVEPNAHTVTVVESPDMRGEIHYRYSETEDGTKVVQNVEYEFGDSLLWRIIGPVARRYNERQFRNALRGSRELIESESERSVTTEAEAKRNETSADEQTDAEIDADSEAEAVVEVKQ